MIGVPMPLIEAHGAVSEEVARAMAEGTLARLAGGDHGVGYRGCRPGRRQRGADPSG